MRPIKSRIVIMQGRKRVLLPPLSQELETIMEWCIRLAVRTHNSNNMDNPAECISWHNSRWAHIEIYLGKAPRNAAV